MSDRDSFIDEVSEEVRRERLYGYLRRYGWIAVAFVLVIVGIASYIEWQRSTARAEAEAFGDSVLTALSAETPVARREALLGIEAEGTREALLAMLAADTLEDDAARGRTLELLTALSEDQSVPPLYRDLATLKAVMLLQIDEEPQAVIDTLAPLTSPGAPFRLLALEQQALAQVRADDTEAALATLGTIAEDGAATPDLQGRVRQLIVALGGDGDGADG